MFICYSSHREPMHLYSPLFPSSSAQFSHSVMSDSLQPHGLQHVRHPCPSPTPRACSNSGPSSWWYHPTISSSVVPFSSRLQSFPASGSFPMSQFFASDGQKYWSFSFSISPSNEYSRLISFRMDWLDLLAVQGTLKSLLQHHSSKASILQCSAFFIVQLSHPYMTTGKTIALTRWKTLGNNQGSPAEHESRFINLGQHLNSQNTGSCSNSIGKIWLRVARNPSHKYLLYTKYSTRC